MLTAEQIVAWLDDELDEAERARFEAQLRAEPDAAERLFDQARLDQALRVALGRPESSARLKESILAVVRGLPLPELDARVRETTFHRRSKPALWLAALRRWFQGRRRVLAWGLAGFAALVLVFNWPRAARPAVPRIVFATPGAVVTRGNQARPVPATAALQPGDELALAESEFATVELPDGTRLDLPPGSRLGIPVAGQTGAARILDGWVTIRAAAQARERPLRLATPQAEIAVLGTVFRVRANSHETLVTVEEGVVEVRSTNDAGPVRVSAGRSAKTIQGQGTLSYVDSRDRLQHPFASDSPWNRSIGSGARFEPLTRPLLDPGRGAGAGASVEVRPVYRWDQGAPELRIESLNREPVLIPFPGVWRPPEPSDTSAMGVLTGDGSAVLELRQITRQEGGTMQIRWWGRTDLSGSGMAPESHGVTEFGGSMLGGALRRGELESGVPHALSLVVPARRLNRRGAGVDPFVWPASRASPGWRHRFGEGGNLFLGSLLALPPDTKLSALGVGDRGPGFELARALRDYGAYVTDATDRDPRLVVVDERVPDGFGPVIAGLLARLQVVVNNSPGTVGGGGIPRREPPAQLAGTEP